MRILVIDDYRPHGESLQAVLEARGHDALYATSYGEAEDYLRFVRFDLAFLDFHMPDMLGTTAAERLCARFPTIRSVIVSANPEAAERHANDRSLLFLRKPVSLPDLGECLARIERELKGSALALRPFLPPTLYRKEGGR